MTVHIQAPLSAEARARHFRLRGVERRVNVIGAVIAKQDKKVSPAPSVAGTEAPFYPSPTLAMKQREPRWHMVAWRAYKEALAAASTPRGFVKLQCFAAGVTYEQVRGPSRRHELVAIRNALIKLAKETYPHLSRAQLGNIFNRDQSTIAHSLGKTDKAAKYQRYKAWKARQEAA